MLCIVAIVDCTHVGSATASPEDLETLHRRTLQQIFWERISYSSTNQIAELSVSHCCGKNHQGKLWLQILTTFSSLFVVVVIASLDRETGRGRLLGLRVLKKQRYLKIIFQCFCGPLCSWFTTLVKYSRHTWSHFGAVNSMKLPTI